MPANRTKLNTWTLEREEMLRSYWRDGLSASQISREFGDVSRNAVIGKTHRMGLPRRGVTRAISKERVKVAQVKAQKPKPKRKPKPEIVEHEPLHLDIMELNAGVCRYPHVHGDRVTYCGHKVADGSSYCAHHKAICQVAGSALKQKEIAA